MKHFTKHPEGHRLGNCVLLIISGHKSHKSLVFQDLSKENKITTLCLSPHAPHLLPPFDVG
jgi:hypothetical protein